MSTSEFLKPVLRGGRFDEHTVPLGFLRDLAALNDIILEVAKAEYLEENKNRRRVPGGFESEMGLSLKQVEEGSAKLTIAILTTMVGFLPDMPPVNLKYYERARDKVVAAIAAADSPDGPPPGLLRNEALRLFKNFGASLRADEEVVFSTGEGTPPARYTKEVQRKIILSEPGVQETQEEVEFRGFVEQLNHPDRSFRLRLADGRSIPGIYPKDQYKNFEDGFTGYHNEVKMMIRGTLVRDRANRPVKFEEIARTAVLDVLDVPAQLEDLRVLKRGWLDGEGASYEAAELDWLERITEGFFPDESPAPRIYPTPEGQVSLEWSPNGWHADLRVDLQAKSGEFNALHLATLEERSESLDLQVPTAWESLKQQLAFIYGERVE